jgi:hypothetical protein
MDLANLELYFERAATNNKAIQHTAQKKHFITFSVEDALSSLKNIEYPALCLEIPNERLSDQLSDNIRAISSSAIVIIKKVGKINPADIVIALKETYIIASQMQSKILNDRKKANQPGRTTPESLIKHLDVNSIQLVDVGPVFDGCYGWRLEFQFNGPKNLELVESDWLPGTETKFNFRD